MNTIDRIDQVFRALDRELWIVIAATEVARGGLTATFVHPAHIDRAAPLLLAGIAANHYTRHLIDSRGTFVAHLLRPEQFALGYHFAQSSGQAHDKLAGLDLTSTPSGALRLADCRAWLECRVLTHYDTGDRIYYWSEVVDAGDCGAGPLLTTHEFFRRLAPDQRANLQELQQQDVEVQRPLQTAWRQRWPASHTNSSEPPER